MKVIWFQKVCEILLLLLLKVSFFPKFIYTLFFFNVYCQKINILVYINWFSQTSSEILKHGRKYIHYSNICYKKILIPKGIKSKYKKLSRVFYL